MKSATVRFEQRRSQLLGKIASDRRQLGDTVAQIRQPLALVDLGWSVIRFVRQHPFAVVSACTALGAILPPPLARWWNWGHLAYRLGAVFRTS